MSDNNYMHCFEFCIHYCDGRNLKNLKIKTLNFDSLVRVMKIMLLGQFKICVLSEKTV